MIPIRSTLIKVYNLFLYKKQYNNNIIFISQQIKHQQTELFFSSGDWVCNKREGNGIEIFYRTRYEGNWKADMVRLQIDFFCN